MPFDTAPSPPPGGGGTHELECRGIKNLSPNTEAPGPRTEWQGNWFVYRISALPVVWMARVGQPPDTPPVGGEVPDGWHNPCFPGLVNQILD